MPDRGVACLVDGTWDGGSGVDAYGRWFSYPHDATATNDMKLHLLVRRATLNENGSDSRVAARSSWSHFFDRGHDLEYFFDHLDFFTAQAHLEAPGTAVQPTVGGEQQRDVDAARSSPSTRRAIANSAKIPELHSHRGQLISGDATITVARGSTPVLGASVSLTNLKGSSVSRSSYPNLSWNNMVINLGSFGRTVRNHVDEPLRNSTISGTFRGTGAAKVGGTFEVPHFYYWQVGRYVGMVGGFVADKQ